MKLDIRLLLAGIVFSIVLFGSIVFADGLMEEINVARNSVKIFINNKEISTDNFIYNDTTYIPLRSIAVNLNDTVYWDDKNNTAKIFTLGLKSEKLAKDEYKIDGLSIGMSMEETKKNIGEPKTIRQEYFREGFPYEGYFCTIWDYDKYFIVFSGEKILGIIVTSDKFETARGIKIGDEYGKVLSLYGKGGYNERWNDIEYCEFEDGAWETTGLKFNLDKDKKVAEIELRLTGY